ALRGNLADDVVAGVCYVEVPRSIYRHAARSREQCVALGIDDTDAAGRTRERAYCSCRINQPYRLIEGVGYVEVAGLVRNYPLRKVERRCGPCVVPRSALAGHSGKGRHGANPASDGNSPDRLVEGIPNVDVA